MLLISSLGKINIIVWNNSDWNINFTENDTVFLRNVRVSTWTREKSIEHQYTIDNLTDWSIL